MKNIAAEITVTMNEIKAFSFFETETLDKQQSATCPSYQALYQANSNKLYAFKSNDDIDAITFFRYETAGKAEETFNLEYLTSFKHHDRSFWHFKNKFKEAMNKSVLKWALNEAKQKGLM